MVGLLATQAGLFALKKLVHFQRLSVPAMNQSAFPENILNAAIKGALSLTMPEVASVKFVPPFRVRRIPRFCEEIAQSVLGRRVEIALSAPSAAQSCSQTLVPVHFS